MFHHNINYEYLKPTHNVVPEAPDGYTRIIKIVIPDYVIWLHIHGTDVNIFMDEDISWKNCDNTPIYEFHSKPHMRDFYVIQEDNGPEYVSRGQSIGVFMIEEAGIYVHLYINHEN